MRNSLPAWCSVLAGLALALTLGAPRAAAAQSEPWLLHLEPSYVLPITDPQRERFEPGLAAAITLERSLGRMFLVGARVRGGALFDGPPPDDPRLVDPGPGGLGSFTLTGRLRPLGRRAGAARGTGLWLDVGGGVAITGELVRPTLEAGLGYGFAWGPVDIGPVIRFQQVVQPAGNFDDRDAHLLLLGLQLTFFDRRGEEPMALDPEHRALPEGDRDADGLLDDEDDCPDDPEDVDDFEDGDGCPDDDNDGDGILDADDECPLEPEDVDGFADEDGCPDPDNDDDGVLDGDDQCPEEPETLNGVEDDDGCPDEGLIEMRNDRIVLEERVLFDFQRARVKRRARPVIDAIVELVRQHPDWVRMRIEGHADVRGDQGYNQELSERRARNVARALVEAGLSRELVESVGFGSSRPRDRRTNEDAHARNRRVEFVLVAQRNADGTVRDTRQVIDVPPSVPVAAGEDADMV
ncbi:MAG: OmpA family protein, partial [Myxococcota bacterium]